MSDDGPTPWLIYRHQWVEMLDGDTAGALVLEQMLQWADLVRKKEERDEWLQKSKRDLSDDIPGLTSYKCQTRLEKLEEMGILKSRRPEGPQSPKKWRVEYEALRDSLSDAGIDPESLRKQPHGDAAYPLDCDNPHLDGSNPHPDCDNPRRGLQQSTPGRQQSTTKGNKQKNTQTSTSEGAPACDNPEPEPDTEPDDQNDLAADGGSKLENDPDASEAADDLSAYEQLFEIDDASRFVEALADFHGVPISSPGTLWMQARGNAPEASEDELRAYLDAKLADLAADERDFPARTIQKYTRQDASDWEEVIGESDDRRSSSTQQTRYPGQLDDELGRDDDLDELLNEGATT